MVLIITAYPTIITFSNAVQFSAQEDYYLSFGNNRHGTSSTKTTGVTMTEQMLIVMASVTLHSL